MNLINDTWRGLVQRKLWPVALLLVAALVAVPLALAKNPEAPVPPVASASGAKAEGMPTTYVSATEDTDENATERRRVLGAEKDPFEPAPLPKVTKKKAKKQATASKAAKTTTPSSTPKTGSGSTGITSGGGGGGGASAPTAPPVSAAPTATPTPTVPKFSIKVRFGTTEGELATKTVERLSVLPDEENPVIVYRGVGDGGKIAIFELTGDVTAQGDGKCLPTPEDCQYLKLRVGETEFITVKDTGDVTDAQYQLDLVKIYKQQTKVTADDSQSDALAKASSLKLKGGLKLRKRNRYVFHAPTGTLRLNGSKTTRATL